MRDPLSRTDNAISSLKSALPPGLLNRLNINSLEVENGTFIENDLSELRSDLLFSIKTISGHPLNIYILFEHKSYRDPKIFTQLLSYIVPHLFAVFPLR